jgi:hypothetical protein
VATPSRTTGARAGDGLGAAREAFTPLTAVSQTGGTTLDSAAHTGHSVDPDLRMRIPAHWPDAPH